MAQANPPPSKPSPLMDSKIEEALSASKSAQEEYIALLEERDKAYAEDPKDTQLHEHMTQLCLDALQKSEEAAEKYANLCAAAKSSSTTTSKLTVVTGPTYSIPPKSVPSSGLDKGADIIKQAEEKEANKNFPEALKLYSKAVDFYLHKIRYELKGAKAKENLRQKVQKCIIKYEKLKDYLLNHTNYETEKLMYLNNGTWPTTKLRYFTAFNQYQLYILLSHNVVEKPPTGIQTSIFEALKNGTFANEKLEALYSLNPIIVNAHKKMREAQEKCGDLLEEKGFAVLEDPQNKALKDDVMKCCCEIFEKWKTAKNKYANIAYFGTPDYGLGATHIDVSNDFGGEKAVEKPYLKSDEISKYDIDKICINNDSNTVNNALEEMKLVEGGNSESSNSNSTQNPSYSNSTENDDPFRIPEDIDLATKEEEQEHVYKLATFANIDPRVSRAYHKMIYVEARVNALQFVYSQQDGFGGCGKMYSKTPYHEKINSEATMKAIELLSNLDSSALKAKYSEAYNAAILELNEARTELQKCIEETRFFKHAPLTFMEFQEEKAKLDEWMKKLDPKTSSNPQESLKNPLSKPVTKREKMFEEAVQKIQNLKQNDKEVTISTPRPFNHSSDFPAASTESNNIQKHLLNPSKVNETNPTTAAASIKAKEMEVDNETAEKTNFNKKFNHKTQQTHLTHPPNEKEELEAAKWRVARQRNLNKFESNRKRGKRDVDEIAKTLSTTATASDALKTFTSGFALYPPTPAQTSIKILEKQLEEAIKNLKDTENSRKTLIEMNEVLKGQKEDFQAKYKSAKELNEYLENECKKLYKDFNEKEQKNVEEFEKGLLQKDATIVRLQTQLAQTKDELLAKNPKILVKILEDVKIVDEKQPKDSDSKFAEELIKVQKQLEYFKKLAADQAEALKNFELAKSLEKQLSHATEKADKAEKALRKREALDSSTQDLILKRFKDSDDDSPVV
uniref:MIT domain-containing protein n=1 Tax=Panagrolaimus sp. ES5 TaxID=591445 RepID=A0AC34F3L2_9BILA